MLWSAIRGAHARATGFRRRRDTISLPYGAQTLVCSLRPIASHSKVIEW